MSPSDQLSIVREYLIMCSTVWTMCMALDLYYLVVARVHLRV